MSFLYLFLYCILAILIICTFVSVVQFFVDLRRCSALRDELKELVDRAKLAEGELAINSTEEVEVDDNSNTD